MKKQLLFFTFSAIAIQAQAQVEDVSVIVSPTIGYHWFDSKSTIENGAMYGLQAGFGFGKFIELRAIYERSINMKQNFGHYEDDVQTVFPNFHFSDRNVKVNKIGGEFKANIQVGSLSPYILLGTGIQTIERNDAFGLTYTNQNLYGSGGIGFKVNMGNRITLNLEGRGAVYNMNPSSMFRSNDNTSAFDNWVNNLDRDRMYNWSATAGLQLYLGGRNENGHLSDIDKAYLNRFSSGMSGLKITLAPAAAHVDFNSKSAYRSTYMLGGILGVDLTDFVGLRGYYYQATEGQNPSFKFDQMGMFGLDFIGKLNVARGIVPYITVGGGYINVQDGYQGKVNEVTGLVDQIPTSGYFAKGGLGLEVPFTPNIGAFGAVNLMYTIGNDNTNVTALRNVDELHRHTMYNVGLRLKFGKNANTNKQTQLAFEEQFYGERAAYNRKIRNLEKELKEAYEQNDIETITKIVEEKKTIEAKLNQTDTIVMPQNNYIKLTPAELQDLIDKVLEGVENDHKTNVDERIDKLESMLLGINGEKKIISADGTTIVSGDHTNSYSAVNDRLLSEISKLNKIVEEQKSSIETLENEKKVMQSTFHVEKKSPVTNDLTSVPADNSTKASKKRFVDDIYTEAVSGYLGYGFGEMSSFNIGARGYLGHRKSIILVMPEAYVAIGNTTGYGLSLNGIVPIKINETSKFAPYAGAGIGVNYINQKTTFNPNVIVGTNYKLGSGNIFADYTTRGLFKHNQVAIGYKFLF